MRLTTVPNWSFGRDRDLLRRMREAIESAGAAVHFAESDPDHNRTVTAFTHDAEALPGLLLRLCDLAFDRIDLNRHTGVHPRIGALDVCPFVPLPGQPMEPAIRASLEFAERLAERFDVPVFLYEKSERGRHEAELPALRKGGFGGLLGRALNPDFGPERAHPRLGVSVVGARDFLIAMNVDLDRPEPDVARDLAREIRRLRAEGDPRFLGVRALGFPLASRGLSQVSLNLTMPDLTPVDPIVAWVRVEAARRGVRTAGTELIGVIRKRDLPTAGTLRVRPQQVVDP
ncbi:MAG: hypothetical protein N2109_10535 [Fimbriimonadales bacterium]|nr:hypothetical protein [Fimbriimonadales bacterium]